MEMEMDRLSALPDDLVIHILSRLSLTEAAQTSVLSRRWRFIWTDLPSLILDEGSEELWEFKYGVEKVLGSRRGAALEYLSLFYYYNKVMDSEVDGWVELAVKNKVQHLRLDQSYRYSSRRWYGGNEEAYDYQYPLHQSMYSNFWLKQLSLSSCTMAPPTTVEWRSMTEISLEDCILPQQQIHNIVSGCPALSRLELVWCRGFNRLEIGGRRFRSLKLKFIEDGLLEISAPYMNHLNVSMKPRTETLRLKNVVSLEKVELCFSLDEDLASPEAMTNAYKIFHTIRCASILVLQYEDLHLRSYTAECEALKVVSMMAANGSPLPQLKVECMELDTYEEVCCIRGIIGILQSSPFLERLSIRSFPDEKTAELDATTWHNLNCNLLRLKIIRITVYVKEVDYCRSSTFELARTLLERAPILEKMDIVFIKSQWDIIPLTISNDLIEKLETLISHPKSSHKAKIVISSIISDYIYRR